MALPFLRLSRVKQYHNFFCSCVPLINSSTQLRTTFPLLHVALYQYVPCSSFWCTPAVSKRRKTREERKNPKPAIYMPKKSTATLIDVWSNITVKELAECCNRDVEDVLEALSYEETEDTYFKPSSQISNFKSIRNAVKRLGLKCNLVAAPNSKKDSGTLLDTQDVQRRKLKPHVQLLPRPPVVTVMGHVDHGKTSLLDALRNSNVVDGEFGGITQHIGAFTVKLSTGAKVTFLDTPGHAAFKAMRNRGAQCTDIVVLVVAADDGVMDQTLESISMANSANVPIIVAINKIDKHGANIDRTKQMLLNNNIMLEEAGGDVQAIPISAKQRLNLDQLVEAISTQAQLLDLRADYEGLVEGVIIESKVDPHRGKLATVLVQHGTLKQGAILTAGLAWAKVKNLFDDSRTQIKNAPPACPVEVMGWRILPEAGDIVLEVETEKKALAVLDYRNQKESAKKIEEASKVIEEKRNEHLKVYLAEVEERRKMGQIKTRRVKAEKEVVDDHPNLRILLKGDVHGSVEALMNVIGSYYDPRCNLDVVSEGVGAVSMSDVDVAEAFNAIIYAFNVNSLKDATSLATTKNVTIKYFNVIYKVVDDLKEELSRRLPFEQREEVIGEAEVLQTFLVSEKRAKVPVAGCRCNKGILKRTENFKVIRRGEVLYTGPVRSMKHLKNEVSSIKENVECGLMFPDINFEFSPGDKIICFSYEDVPQKIKWDPGF